jgi:hypothetical protein
MRLTKLHVQQLVVKFQIGMKKENHHYILCSAYKCMINILEKIKKIDGFILGTLIALFLTIVMILFFATMKGQ